MLHSIYKLSKNKRLRTSVQCASTEMKREETHRAQVELAQCISCYDEFCNYKFEQKQKFQCVTMVWSSE